MLALPSHSPCLFSTLSHWPLGTSDSFLDFPVPEISRDRSPTSSSDPKTSKKLYHNASERDRRKKINHLYSSIRSMLPEKNEHSMHVLKYMPELQEEVVKLNRKKEELLLMISKQDGDGTPQEKLGTIGRKSSKVAAGRLSNGEVAIQISTDKSSSEVSVSVSDMMLTLDKEELLLLNASFFESYGGKLFSNFHLKVVEGRCRVDCKLLSEKLLSLCDN